MNLPCHSSGFTRIYQVTAIFFSMHVNIASLSLCPKAKKGERKLSLFTNDNYFCVAKTDKTLELIRDVRNLAGKKLM